MDVIFNCPKCEQELAVDSSGAGTEINCPSCGEAIVIPEPEPMISRGGAEAGGVRIEAHPINPIASSAAAKVEMHLRVPVRKTPTESLIEKPLAPLEVAKDADKKIRTKTIRHTHLDIGTQKLLTDFGVMVVYKG